MSVNHGGHDDSNADPFPSHGCFQQSGAFNWKSLAQGLSAFLSICAASVGNAPIE